MIKQKAAVAGLMAALLLICACRKSTTSQQPGAGPTAIHGRGGPREFEIHIYQDPDDKTKCFADLPAATLWERDTHTVLWVSDDVQYTIDFRKDGGGHSPFTQPDPFFRMQQSSTSSPWQIQSGHVKKIKEYDDYWIRVGDEKGTPCNKGTDGDPGIYVKP